MKFKVGDKVRVVANSCRHGYAIGSILTIKRSHETTDCGESNHLDVNEGATYVEKADVVLLNGKKYKPQPIQFVAVYDEDDGDPHKLFYSRKELTVWLKEAKDNSEIIWSSIKVFKIAGQYEIKTSFRLKRI